MILQYWSLWQRFLLGYEYPITEFPGVDRCRTKVTNVKNKIAEFLYIWRWGKGFGGEGELDGHNYINH